MPTILGMSGCIHGARIRIQFRPGPSARFKRFRTSFSPDRVAPRAIRRGSSRLGGGPLPRSDSGPFGIPTHVAFESSMTTKNAIQTTAHHSCLNRSARYDVGSRQAAAERGPTRPSSHCQKRAIPGSAPAVLPTARRPFAHGPASKQTSRGPAMGRLGPGVVRRDRRPQPMVRIGEAP